MGRDGNFSRWDGILRDPIPFGTGLGHFFISITYAGRESDWKIPSHPVSLPIKNKNFFNWDGIPQDPISFGTGLRYIFVPKKYRDGIETFFHPICIYGMGLGLVNPIPSRPIANSNYIYIYNSRDINTLMTIWTFIRVMDSYVEISLYKHDMINIQVDKNMTHLIIISIFFILINKNLGNSPI